MINSQAACRRLQVLTRLLNKDSHRVWNYDSMIFRYCSASAKPKAEIGEDSVTIGDVKKIVVPPKHAEFVPSKYLRENLDQDTLHHLRWMLQKDSLKQDIFLVGPPGPLKRRVAMQFLEATQKELEFVSLSRDTTESDLKQRREIESATSKYIDQGAVRAALEGRVLLLEGIEKAERNVLPILNNLLENREMHLEDGRFLIPAEQYDKLFKEFGDAQMKKWRLLRVSENFRVIALGLPVPGYQGNPLDPPLRSRFQARDVPPTNYHDSLDMLTKIYPEISDKVTTLLSCAYTLISPEASSLGLPDFPIDNLPSAVKIMALYPWVGVNEALSILYPVKSLLPPEGIRSVNGLLDNFQVGGERVKARVTGVERVDSNNALVTLTSDHQAVPQLVACGNLELGCQSKEMIKENQEELLSELVESHSVGDICLVGPRGCGKSLAITQLANLLGYSVEPIVLYQDMSSRDLIQQRTTLENGDTVWRNAPLVTAALQGKLAILDGLHRLHPSTLASIHRLVHERELQLYNGMRLMSSSRYDSLVEKIGEEAVINSKILKIHPSFRIIALAEPNSHIVGDASQKWLNPELLSLFLYHQMRPLNIDEESFLIEKMYGELDSCVKEVLEVSHALKESKDVTLHSLSGSLSTRQLIRIAKRSAAYPHQGCAYNIIQTACLAKFLPPLGKQALDSVLEKMGVSKLPALKSLPHGRIIVDDEFTTIGQTVIPRYKASDTSKVPDILFYDVPQHVSLLERLAQDFVLGEHLLLVGNQGVGKNKLVDRLLQLLNRPREYIQLHRDTTVQCLTVQPKVVGGVVSYEDSPLVNAVRSGRVLVVDEADKAPTHVTCILKSLVENGEMILLDGRRIVPGDDQRISAGRPDLIPIHPDFRMIVLANRPGFPFLGNDFFAALGDLFSCHAVDNPSPDSERELLMSYGPDVPAETINKLVAAFSKLRSLADQGLVSYPYSTRELVNIIKHLQVYPEDSLSDAVGNVFDFDRYSQDMRDTLIDVLTEFNIPVAMTSEERATKRKRIQMTVEKESGKDVSGPKHGKVDATGAPHVGGNTWAGGTGGRDTAGLGGKGGPYRLDGGHNVYQVSEAEKAAVPEHIRKAAREMGQKAFKAKLEEINMSQYDHTLYEEYASAVTKQVQSLRVILSSLQAKSKERQWSKHQTSGELDDTKLIEGLTGERNIYKRRSEKEPEVGAPQLKPKRLKLVVDVSGSMYRFNGYDGRMDRQLEAVVMLMESFQGFETRFQYDIVGHSGESPAIQFVDKSMPPTNNKERLKIMRLMHAHSQFCMSGDYTLEAIDESVKSLAKEDCDEAFVVVLSDANLSRYAIPPAELATSLCSDQKIEAFAVFIGSLGNEAAKLSQALPAGRGFVCLDVKELPKILQTIFTSSMLRSR